MHLTEGKSSKFKEKDNGMGKKLYNLGA
jgi:hypothetical protein